MPPDKQLVDMLIKGLEESRQSNKCVQDQVSVLNIAVAEMKGDVQKLNKDVSQLLTIIRDGNGKEPLVTRMTKMEDKMVEMDKFKDTIKVANQENIKGKWVFRAALVAGFGSLAATIATNIIKALG